MACVHSVLSSVAVVILLCACVPAWRMRTETEDGSPIFLASHSLSLIVANHVASERHVVCDGDTTGTSHLFITALRCPAEAASGEECIS